MCGICGAASDWLSKNELDAFNDLLVVSAFRGLDSTGVMSATREKYNTPVEYMVQKEDQDPYYFLSLNDDYTKKVMAASKKIALVGHTRAATVGKINRDNAHPFEFEHIIGVHNGTIRGRFDYCDEYETDSQALYRNINDKGIHAALQHVQDHATSVAYALVFFDKRNNSLNFIRNSQRPLYFCTANNNRSVYWASEESFLNFILARHRIVHEKPWMLKPNLLMSLDVDAKDPVRAWRNEEDIVKYPPQQPAVQTPPWRGSWGYGDGMEEYFRPGNYGSYRSGYGRSGNEMPAKPVTLISDARDARAKQAEIVEKLKTTHNESLPVHELPDMDGFQKSVRDRDGFYTGYNGIRIPGAEYVKILNDGCTWCDKPSTTRESIRWLSRQEFVCSDCKKSPELMEYLNISTGMIMGTKPSIN